MFTLVLWVETAIVPKHKGMGCSFLQLTYINNDTAELDYSTCTSSVYLTKACEINSDLLIWH